MVDKRINQKLYKRSNLKSEKMNKENLVKELETRLKKISPNVDAIPTKVGKGESDWSKTIQPCDSKHPDDTLKEIFGIVSDNWDTLFQQVAYGSGKEINRILTLHSSALLALLCFHNIANQPIVIEHSDKEIEEYNECWFEVKNKVFDKPSSIDVVLKSKKGNLLFLESKFTEYLSSESPNIKMKYWDFYLRLLKKIPGLPLQMVYPKQWKEDGEDVIGFTLQPTSKRKDYADIYLAGIKQCLSHIIGIYNGPQNNAEPCWQNVTPETKLRFGCIVYKFSGEFKKYNSFYKETIGQLNPKIISEAMDGRGNYTQQIEILPELLTYQKLFKGNLLPKIAQFYNL